MYPGYQDNLLFDLPLRYLSRLLSSTYRLVTLYFFSSHHCCSFLTPPPLLRLSGCIFVIVASSQLLFSSFSWLVSLRCFVFLPVSFPFPSCPPLVISPSLYSFLRFLSGIPPFFVIHAVSDVALSHPHGCCQTRSTRLNRSFSVEQTSGDSEEVVH